MNRIILIGRLTRDPELKKTATNLSVSSFSIAVDRRFKRGDGEQTTDFFNCTAWRETAERLCQYMKKGSLICVEGQMLTRKYLNKENVTVTAYDVQADSITFLESKKLQQVSEDNNSIQNNTTDDDLTTNDEPILF